MPWVSREPGSQQRAHHNQKCRALVGVPPEQLEFISDLQALRDGYSTCPDCRPMEDTEDTSPWACFVIVAVVVGFVGLMLYLSLTGQMDFELEWGGLD